MAVDTDSGLQQDSRGPLSCPAPALGALVSWSTKTSGIVTMKMFGESLHCSSHVSKLHSLQSNLRMQEVSKLETSTKVLVLSGLVVRRKLLLGRPKQMLSQKIIVHLHQHRALFVHLQIHLMISHLELGFRKVYICEYEVVPGCNPSVSCGPLLELGWQHITHRAVDFESMKILVKARDEGEPICT